MEQLTSEELDILRHALGADPLRPGLKVGWRNNYCAGGDDVAVCDSLVRKGMMRKYGGSIETCGPVYSATNDGIRLIQAEVTMLKLEKRRIAAGREP